MDFIDLDTVLCDTRKAMISLSKIDVDDKFADISIDRIIMEIKEISSNLAENNEQTHHRESVQSFSKVEARYIKALRKLDSKLRSISLYDNKIRPILKKVFSKRLINKRIINAKDLLRFEGEEFVDVLYRSLLLRDPDESGKMNALELIKQSREMKVELVYCLVNSIEGKQHNINVKGLYIKRIFLNIKRVLYSIPIIGYIIRFFVNLFLLPIRLKNIQKSFDDVYTKINLLKNNKEHTEDIANSLKGKINEEISKSEQYANMIKTKMIKIEEINKNIVVKEKELNDKKRVEKELIDKFYLRYNEVIMPDSREDVKNRAGIYIDKLKDIFKDSSLDKLKVLDLGCGECEWIELLNENGFKAQGVDSNSYVVKKVRDNFPDIYIEESDAFRYLKSLSDNSIDMISSFHMVEHLDFIEIIELLVECERVLKKGGLLLIETPNPQNILTSTYYFNMDPTHKKPIPPELLSFIVTESGLLVKEKIMLHPLSFITYDFSNKNDPIRDIVFRFNIEQAYSVLAVKE